MAFDDWKKEYAKIDASLPFHEISTDSETRSRQEGVIPNMTNVSNLDTLTHSRQSFPNMTPHSPFQTQVFGYPGISQIGYNPSDSWQYYRTHPTAGGFSTANGGFTDLGHYEQSYATPSNIWYTTSVIPPIHVALPGNVVQGDFQSEPVNIKQETGELNGNGHVHDGEFVEKKKVSKPFIPRIAKACEHCSQRKKKCNGKNPCERCTKLNLDCQYLLRTAKPGPKGPWKHVDRHVD